MIVFRSGLISVQGGYGRFADQSANTLPPPCACDIWPASLRLHSPVSRDIGLFVCPAKLAHAVCLTATSPCSCGRKFDWRRWPTAGSDEAPSALRALRVQFSLLPFQGHCDMTAYRQIRAEYDRTSIVVYQAFNDAISDAAIDAQTFVAPFSLNRMTWIKPSFLWLMERSGWATKSDQTRILAVRVTRSGWDEFLSQAVLTSFEPGIDQSVDNWRSRFDAARVHVQWDPERSIRGRKLEHRTIQVGISRHVIADFVSSIQRIEDMTALADKLRRMRLAGKHSAARQLLPAEREYPVVHDTR